MAGNTQANPQNPTADAVPTSLRRAWREAHLVPLWESPTAHKLDVVREKAHHWPWRVMRPILEQTSALSSPNVVERRVLSLVNPKSRSPEDEATTGTINACLQTLLPGERARPHRHSMNALRFALQGEGAETVVDGRALPHVRGRPHPHAGVVLARARPPWEHPLRLAGRSRRSLHLFLGTDEFQPGPVRDLPARPPTSRSPARASFRALATHRPSTRRSSGIHGWTLSRRLIERRRTPTGRAECAIPIPSTAAPAWRHSTAMHCSWRRGARHDRSAARRARCARWSREAG